MGLIRVEIGKNRFPLPFSLRGFQMKKQFYAGVALAAFGVPGMAFAQSTGTIDAEEIVVTANKTQEGIQGVIVPDTPKARTVLTQEIIQTQSSGQSIINVINVVPSVNFTNNDAYGSSGGNVRIRGFDGNRISLTWDGVPLNDTGNYAIFSNQTLDPEIIDQVNVNQGTTDVDSPTASAAGGTINYRTAVPNEEMGVIAKATVGTFDYFRLFGRIDSGSLTSSGTRLFVSAAMAKNDKYRGAGEINKHQYNFRIYQPLSGNDFISVAGHLNKNRNTFYRNLTLTQAFVDLSDGRFDFDNNVSCTRATFGAGAQNENNGVPQAATAIPTNLVTQTGLDTSCSNYYGVRINPSNTGNIRINSKFSLSDSVTLTVDPSFQYVLANGGGFATISETDARIKGVNATGPGKDLSGDGDTLDTVAFYAPNNTNTRRYGLLASLRWDFSEGQSIRIAYAYDRGRHRQTGEWGPLDSLGNPENVFGGNKGTTVTATDGTLIRGRDRLSVALLNQLSAVYRGKFFDDALEVELGIRSPWFKRQLNQYCYTQAFSGNNNLSTGAQTCSSQPISTLRIIGPSDPVPTTGAAALYAPFTATYKFHKLLPNLGLTYKFSDQVSVFGSFAKGFSSPRTDNLYRAPRVTIEPETTSNFDLGIRYGNGKVRGSLGAFYNKFSNRIVTSFDQALGISVDRNIGAVSIKGLEASLDFKATSWLDFHGFGSYINGRLKENIQLGVTTAGVNGATVSGTPIIALTKGKKLVETPTLQYGYTARAKFDPVSFGVSFKHVSGRFATDLNDVRVQAYNNFDADLRFNFKKFGYDKIFFQLNVHNLFNERYFGSISSQIAAPTNSLGLVTGLPTTSSLTPYGGNNPTFAINSPRAISATLQIGF
jgi:iron complex outermembrane recepter protein